MDKTYIELVELWNKCHKTVDRNHPSVMVWAKKMENMLGPDTCKGFILRRLDKHVRGLFIQDGDYMLVRAVHQAKLFTWGEAAVKITLDKKIEAIRVDHNGVAQDSTGLIVGII